MELGKECFEHILEEGEEVLLTLRPNRRRFIYTGGIGGGLFALIILGLMVTLPILAMNGVIGGTADMGGFWFMLVFVGIFAAIIIASIVGVFLSYRNTIFAVTSRRIIIRGGAIGVDYRSLEFTAIGSIDVRVDLMDKILKPETGTIVFGTAMYNADRDRQGNPKAFAFAHIEHPYDNYKKIKALVDEAKGRK